MGTGDGLGATSGSMYRSLLAAAPAVNMNFTTYIVIAVLLGGVLAVVTGYWRSVMWFVAIRPGRMTVERLGLQVESAESVDRVNAILRSFAGGFNAMVTSRAMELAGGYCDALPVLQRPFAEEGVAMGYTLRRLFRYDAAAFERQLVLNRPQYRYLYYVGLGFWSGMRNHDAERLARITSGLDPLHRYLCFDGYGFKRAFFDYPKDHRGLEPISKLEGYAKNAAYQGVGRALFFLYMDRPDLIIEHAGRLGEYAKDAAGGLGLAAVFVFPDRLEVARRLAMRLPEEWRLPFHLGMCFALKARSINDLDRFESDLARHDPAVRAAAWASIRECDRIELQVRAEGGVDGYRRWRERVSAWMSKNIEYPLARVIPADRSCGVERAEMAAREEATT